MYFFCGMRTLSARDEFPDSPKFSTWRSTTLPRSRSRARAPESRAWAVAPVGKVVSITVLNAAATRCGLARGGLSAVQPDGRMHYTHGRANRAVAGEAARDWDARPWWCGCNWRPPGGRRSLADPEQGRPAREFRGLTRVRGQALQGRAGDWRLTSRTPACDTTTRCRPSRRPRPVRAVRFGRVGGGRCRAGPTAGRTGFALLRRLAGVERGRDACGGRLPRAGRRPGDAPGWP